MSTEREQLRAEVSRLQTKLDRVKLAGERIEQIYKRANLRRFHDVHSHEARAIVENCRIIAGEFSDGQGRPQTSGLRPGPFWTQQQEEGDK